MTHRSLDLDAWMVIGRHALDNGRRCYYFDEHAIWARDLPRWHDMGLGRFPAPIKLR